MQDCYHIEDVVGTLNAIYGQNKVATDDIALPTSHLSTQIGGFAHIVLRNEPK